MLLLDKHDPHLEDFRSDISKILLTDLQINRLPYCHFRQNRNNSISLDRTDSLGKRAHKQIQLLLVFPLRAQNSKL